MNTRFARMLVAIVATLSLGLVACSSSGAPSGTAQKVITVNGSASVKVEPNVCNFYVSITAEGNSAPAAQKAMAEPTNAVIAALKDLGVPAENIQTTNTDVSPIWDEDGKNDTYEARSTISVTGVSVDEVDQLMQAATDAGATEVYGLEYLTSSYEDAYQEALTKAIEATRPKAEAIAQASNVSIGDVVSVTEGYESSSYYAAEQAEDAKAAVAGDVDLGIEPGQVEITAEVTVGYAIR